MIAIIKYNAGNTRSVEHALKRLGYACCITDDAHTISQAEKVILPGVGEAGAAMQYLSEKKLHTLIPALQQPVLGICLGLQLMCAFSEESNTMGMGIFDTTVKRFPRNAIVPHTGWNNAVMLHGALFEHLSPGDDLYYVHSYYAETGPYTTAVCDYVLPFSAAMQKNNFYAVQFHPEKSAAAGAIVLKNFLAL